MCRLLQVTAELQRRVLREFGVGSSQLPGVSLDAALRSMRQAPHAQPELKPLCIYHRHQRSRQGDFKAGDLLPPLPAVGLDCRCVTELPPGSWHPPPLPHTPASPFPATPTPHPECQHGCQDGMQPMGCACMDDRAWMAGYVAPCTAASGHSRSGTHPSGCPPHPIKAAVHRVWCVQEGLAGQRAGSRVPAGAAGGQLLVTPVPRARVVHV
jgi:hypothetical protein